MFIEIPIGAEADKYWREGLLWVWSSVEDAWRLDTTTDDTCAPTRFVIRMRYALLLED